MTTDFAVHLIVSLLLCLFFTGYDDLKVKDVVVIVLIIGFVKEFMVDPHLFNSDAQWNDLYGNAIGVLVYILIYRIYKKI